MLIPQLTYELMLCQTVPILHVLDGYLSARDTYIALLPDSPNATHDIQFPPIISCVNNPIIISDVSTKV